MKRKLWKVDYGIVKNAIVKNINITKNDYMEDEYKIYVVAEFKEKRKKMKTKIKKYAELTKAKKLKLLKELKEAVTELKDLKDDF